MSARPEANTVSACGRAVGSSSGWQAGGWLAGGPLSAPPPRVRTAIACPPTLADGAVGAPLPSPALPCPPTPPHLCHSPWPAPPHPSSATSASPGGAAPTTSWGRRCSWPRRSWTSRARWVGGRAGLGSLAARGVQHPASDRGPPPTHLALFVRHLRGHEQGSPRCRRSRTSGPRRSRSRVTGQSRGRRDCRSMLLMRRVPPMTMGRVGLSRRVGHWHALSRSSVGRAGPPGKGLCRRPPEREKMPADGMPWGRQRQVMWRVVLQRLQQA